ncbi:hypothetical protein [Candidatus Nesciobacter abundans]|uniref:Elongation factor P C-terminal domain-containing protein n=1 Tax=Candidatus Nesciobacter abundans TaxID=2601668 RepID=A0A5C0UG27_9PROT|nr:hypothetical protein [Candidatus Nesciobacter abundans]QEK39056.1 hypothetical protein FZC36_01225 [Candidatus Nesciobacter abundans]
MIEKIKASNLKKGHIIDFDNELFEIRDISHVKPGKGRAYFQVEMKSFTGHRKLDRRFGTDDVFNKAIIEEKILRFDYYMNGVYNFFCDTTNEVYEIRNNEQNDKNKKKHNLFDFLQDDVNISAFFYDDNFINFKFRDDVVFEVKEAASYTKGQTAAASYKNAVLSNDVKVSVPTYINSGDKIIIDPYSGDFKEKYKGN